MGIAEEMRDLAAAVGLPLTLAGVGELEARIAAIATRDAGAFVGEVIRSLGGADVEWIEHGGAPALRVAGVTWFPLDKVEKYRRNGRSDSLVAFAEVVIGMVARTPEQIAAGQAKDAQRAAKATVAGHAFVAQPSVDTLCALTNASEWPVEVVRETRLRAALFVPFLGEKPRGLGTKRQYPAMVAAAWIARLVELGVESRADAFALLEAVAKPARGEAAYARGLIDLRDGVVDAAMFASEQRAVVDGVLRSLRAVVWQWFQGPAQIPFASLADALRPALAPASPHVEHALAILGTWSKERERAAEIAPMIGEVLAVAETPKKAAHAKAAQLVLTHYARAIARGLAAEDPRVAEQVAAIRARQ